MLRADGPVLRIQPQQAVEAVSAMILVIIHPGRKVGQAAGGRIVLHPWIITAHRIHSDE